MSSGEGMHSSNPHARSLSVLGEPGFFGVNKLSCPPAEILPTSTSQTSGASARENLWQKFPMRILIAIMLFILASGGAWILNFESNLVTVAPCSSNIDGKFIARKNCDPNVSGAAAK